MARATGLVVLVGGCIVLGDGPLPFAPVTEALRGPDPAEPSQTSSTPSSATVGRSWPGSMPDLGPSADEARC